MSLGAPWSEDFLWDVYCGMTCDRGSERKQCPCDGPLDCELVGHPDYGARRAIAKQRMLDRMRGSVDKMLDRFQRPEGQ